MFIIRGAVFFVVLACSFVLSGNLDGIDQIRGGIAIMVSSFSETINTGVDSSVTTASKRGIGVYLNPATLKYVAILVIVYIGFFRASLLNAIVLGVITGILFSPEIRQVPILAEHSVIINDFVSNVVADIKQRASTFSTP